MREFLLLLSLVAMSVSCTRELKVVRPPPEAEPDFLGAYSGVYRGVETGNGDELARTVVIQLRNKIVMSPFRLVDGIPRLSVFASVGELPEDPTTPVRTETTVVLGAADGVFRSGTCDPGEDLSGLAPVDLFNFVAQRLNQCEAGPPEDCTSICYLPNLFALDAGALGTCVGDGTLCAYTVAVYGRVGRDVIQLLFDQNTVAPSPPFRGLECTPSATEPTGWQDCIPSVDECSEGFAVCLPLDKLCDFDSRVAGVYRATLRLEGEGTNDPQPRLTEGEVELAVAIANNTPAVIFFLSDEELGDRLLIGGLDPGDLTFTANDGDSPLDAGWSIRDGREPDIQIGGKVVEDIAAGVVNLNGTWVESRDDGNRIATYSLTASRLSGVSPGAACQSMEACEPASVACPLGNTTAIRGSTAQIDYEITSGGCITGECQRFLDAGRSLCEPLPNCGGARFGDIYEAYDLSLSPPTCPENNENCNDPESCVKFRCHQGASTPANWYQIDPRCDAATTLTMEYEGSGGIRIRCDDEPLCPSFAPSCPMGMSSEIETALIPTVWDDGCVHWRCEQFFTPDDICSDLPSPTCTPSELLVPSIRVVAEAPDCIELTCQPNCDTGDCSGCGLCGPFDVTDCGASSVKVTEDCGGCLRTECANPACPYEPATCPLGDTGAYQTRLVPQWAGDGCVQFACEQYYRDHQVCVSSPTSCPGGEMLVPGPHPTDGCLEYTCEPGSGTDPTTCNDWVRVLQNPDGKLFVDCQLLPCETRSVDCAVDLEPLQQRFEPRLDSLLCLQLDCIQYYDPDDMCSGAVLPSALGCGGGDVPTLVKRSGFDCLEHVCAPSCTGTCVDCGGAACADPTFPDSCNSEEVVVVSPECGDCISAQCQRL